jgi:hypothetical protein
MKIKFKYSELSETAQAVARKEYQAGWNETHPKDKFNDYELHGFCLDTDDECWFTENGNEIFEEDEENEN